MSVAMAEIAENVQEGPLALAMGIDLEVVQAIMTEDLTAVCRRRESMTRRGPRCVMAPRPARSLWVGVGADPAAADACRRREG